MATSPQLSVIVPVFNVEKYLDRCVASICRQSVGAMEIILVDDASTDGSRRLCEAWARRDRRIRLVMQERNSGLSAARNAGLACARGVYLTFVDADDELADDTYAANLPLFGMADDVDVVEFPVHVYKGHPSAELWRPTLHLCRIDGWLAEGGYARCYACNKIFRRELWAEARFVPGKYYEDILTIPGVMARARRIACSDQGRYDYIYRAGSISTRPTPKRLRHLLEARAQLYGLMEAQLGRKHPVTERYYLDVCNAQISSLAAGGELLFPARRVSLRRLMSCRVGVTAWFKALLNNLLGVRYCTVYAFLLKKCKRS